MESLTLLLLWPGHTGSAHPPRTFSRGARLPASASGWLSRVALRARGTTVALTWAGVCGPVATAAPLGRGVKSPGGFWLCAVCWECHQGPFFFLCSPKAWRARGPVNKGGQRCIGLVVCPARPRPRRPRAAGAPRSRLRPQSPEVLSGSWAPLGGAQASCRRWRRGPPGGQRQVDLGSRAFGGQPFYSLGPQRELSAPNFQIWKALAGQT